MSKPPIVRPELVRYLGELAPPRGGALAEMEAHAAERGFPIVGPLVGQLLFVLARSIEARRVLELGSGFGYSTHWFARAVGEGGEVVHTEGSEENSARARRWLASEGLAERVRFRVGDALELARDEQGPFDLVFCDVDKHQYPDVPDLALPLLRRGGLLIFDNLLWDGRVVDEDPASPSTRGVLEVNRRLAEDPRLATTILPLRDGVGVSLKLD